MKAKLTALGIILFLFQYFVLAQTELPRLRINFDNDWRFHLGNASDPARDFNFRIATIFSKTGKADQTAIETKFTDKDWTSVQLPHDWVEDLPFENSTNFDVISHGFKPVGGLYPQNSIGWYRKHFSVSRADSGHRFSIQFDGIFRDSKVWINGIYLGTNESGYVGVCYDVTDFLNFGKENIIVVRVDASQYEGWFYEGAGIYRHAWLNEYNNVHILQDGMYVHSTVQKNIATVHIQTTSENTGLTSSGNTLVSYITDREGKKITQSVEQKLSLPVNGKATISQQLKVTSPHLWSVEDPYLYRAVVIVKRGIHVIDSINTRIGIRTISIRNDGLFVNGKYVKIKGVNCHQDNASVGSALPDYLQYYRVNLLKRVGVNAYRTSHHAPTPELLDACDSLGLLVLDEQRLLNSAPEYMNQFERLLRRDRNHASVFLWSIGNEEGYVHTSTVGKRIAQTLLAKQLELDPSRTSTYAADVANVYHGVNEVIPVRGFNYRILGVDPYHADHPMQPIIGTEMGSTVTTRGIYIKDTVNAYLPDEDITAPWWANTAEQWWTLAATRPWWIGGFVWTGFDYRGEPTPYEWPNINSHFGIMDVCGFPKNIYYYYQSWWSDKDVLHISPHWNWPDKATSDKGGEGKPVNVWVNSNADNVELFLNGRSQGKKDMPVNKHLEWNIPYEKGTLSAIAYKHGRKLTSKVETTGEPTEVIITPYKTTLIADGADATVINVRVIDKQGREVPDANNLIHFSITGNAKIIGVGNGDPSSHEPDHCEDGKWQRKLFNGKCQFIIRAGTKGDIIKVQASSDKLFTGSTGIHTIQPGAPHNLTNAGIQPIKEVGKMLGADISFLPQLESRGIKFSDNGIEKDPIQILKDHGINYIRLRIFNDPGRDSGYSPKKGFCDLEHTLQMAKRVKATGMKLLLDFHYSDYWADPEKQFKPAEWKGLDSKQLNKALNGFTRNVLIALKAQGTLPDMVQIGNEINHGIVWPDAHISKLDTLAELLNAGIKAVKEIAPSASIMLHIALGGQNDECEFFLNNMIERGVQFDIIGLSYYPKWHGTLEDLQQNLSDLAKKYRQNLIVIEYSQLKKEVNDIIFSLPGNKGKGSCIWEPLNTGEAIFDKEGKSNGLLNVYDALSDFYIKR